MQRTLNPTRFLLFAIVMLHFVAAAQTTVSGSIADISGALAGVTVRALHSDSTFAGGAVTDTSGNFSMTLAGGRYLFKMELLGYKTTFRSLDVSGPATTLGKITMRQDLQTLSEVKVEGVQERGKQKGDTTQFNADAFKTHPDATAEDLIKKMPGVTSDNNGVKVNGETVQKVLVDGKPFFGDDPSATLKNLPADVIERAEVFDKMSDQSQFTGFNDGNQQKTINLVTKKGKNIGQFGRVYAGGGGDESYNGRYNAGAVVNSFGKTRRVSLLLLSNNVNQQNFSISDITGAMGGQSQGGGGRSGGGGQGAGGFGAQSALLAASQNGITATQSAGLNYSDDWGKKIKVSGSYFFNYSDNNSHTELVRNYFSQNRMVYSQVNSDQTTNLNHRANLRFEYTIDSLNKLILTPSFNFQDNHIRSVLAASNMIYDNVPLSNTQTSSRTGNTGYDFSNGILFQHKFGKPGRTISLGVNTQLTEKTNDGSYNSQTAYADTTTGLNQLYNLYGYTRKVSVTLAYTEALGKNGQLQASYNPSYTESRSNKYTNDYDNAAKDYVDFDIGLSNKYSNIYQTQRGGLSYRYNKSKLNLSFGADAQQSKLTGDQTYPVKFSIDQGFNNILPNAQLNYRFSQSRNLRVYYRTSTNIPSVSQLQSVLDISNPLQVKTGNAALKQTFDNNLSIRFGGFNAATARNAMLFLNGAYSDNYISNATYILRSDSTINGYTVKTGSQLNKPVNLNNYYTARAFIVYGFPLKAIRSNMNLSGGLNYGHTPSLNNEILNYANSYAVNGGVFIGSNISQNLDFSLSYNGNYTIVKNSRQTQSDNSFFNHAASFKINWIIYKGLVLNTDVTHTLYNGLTQSFNQDYFLWNAYLGYKFLKSKQLEAKLYMFDILNQNRSISRTVNGNYTEDNNTVVLKRYLMFTLTYTIRNLKGGSAPAEEKQEPQQMRSPWQGRPQ